MSAEMFALLAASSTLLTTLVLLPICVWMAPSCWLALRPRQWHCAHCRVGTALRMTRIGLLADLFGPRTSVMTHAC